MLPWIVAGVALIVLLVAVVVSARGTRELQVAHEESIATKNEQIASLAAQVASLRESESIRFVDRYVAAKKGLEERVANLHEQLEAARQHEEKVRAELNDLTLSERDRESEADRLRRDLHRTSDQVRRLELILREVANVGPMDVNPIRGELDSRRDLAIHIRERLDRLSLEEQDRIAARKGHALKLERMAEEVAKVRRDIEITRAAASIVDGILGIDSETRKRLARHASDNIEGALESLSDAARRGPISQFVEVLERHRPERLLERGNEAAEPSSADVDSAPTGAEEAEASAPPIPRGPSPLVTAPTSGPEVVATPARSDSHGLAWRERAAGPYWTTVS